MDHPQLLAQPSADHPDEIGCLISIVPTFVAAEPQDLELETAENERPEELESVVEDPDDNVFFFIVDCSGSMQGQNIDMTREALALFVQSLPAGCKFEIVLFGDRFDLMSDDGSGFINNDETLSALRPRIG